MPFLARFFPPPKFLAMPAVGIDISDRSVKYAELINGRRGLQLGIFGKKNLEPHIVDAGEIKKPAELASFLAALFKPLGVRYVIASLPEERAYAAAFQMPRIEDALDLRSAIELELSQHIPLPLSEALFDYEIVPSVDVMPRDKIKADRPTHLDVMVYAFPRTLAESYMQVFEDAGLVPVALEMETQALVRALLPPEGVSRPVMIVDFGKTRATFVIAVGNLVRYTSTVSVAGESLDAALAKTLKISTAEAEKIKKEKGLSNERSNEAVFNAFVPVVSAIADEIERHILFWNTHAEHVHQSSPQISSVILCGGDANLIGFKEYLAQKLKLPITYANTWAHITSFSTYIPEIPFNESLGFAEAVGLALRAARGE